MPVGVLEVVEAGFWSGRGEVVGWVVGDAVSCCLLFDEDVAQHVRLWLE